MIHHDRFPTIDNVLVEIWKYKFGERVLDERFSIHNLITNSGKDMLADHLIGTSSATLSYFAIGVGSTPATAGDLTLSSEVYRDAVTSSVRTSIGLATLTYFLSTSSANGNTLAEIGLLTAASVGILFARAVLGPTIVKNNTKAVTFTWNVSNA